MHTGYDIRHKLQKYQEFKRQHQEKIRASEATNDSTSEQAEAANATEVDPATSPWHFVAHHAFEIMDGKYGLYSQSIVIVAILGAAVLAGVKQSSDKEDPAVDALEMVISVIFLLEAFLKILGGGDTDPPAHLVESEMEKYNDLDADDPKKQKPFRVRLVRSAPHKYFYSAWNCFDFVVTIVCWLPISSAGLVLRLLRLFRLLRLLHMVPQLQLILRGLAAGMTSIFVILFLLFLVFYMYAIVGIVIFQPNDPTHFRSLDVALLSMFRIVTLEDWTDVMYVNWYSCAKYGYTEGTVDASFRCSNDDSHGVVSIMYHVSLVLGGSLVMLSLFVGVITTSMQEESDRYHERQRDLSLRQKMLANKRQQQRDRRVRTIVECALRGDAAALASTIDAMRQEKANGAADADADADTALGRYVRFAKRVDAFVESDRFNYLSGAVILLASVLIGIRVDPALDKNAAVVVLDLLCLLYFTVEVVVKMVACGKRPWAFFLGGWNNFDFLIVVLSWYYSKMKVVRIVRLLRVSKFASAFPQIQVIIEGLISGLASVMYILLLMLMQFYMFAIIGMMLFKKNDPWHFGSVARTFVTLFRCATLEDWTDVMYINVYGCHRYPENPTNDGSGYADLTGMGCDPVARGWVAAAYFVAFIIIGSMVTLSLFVGVVTAGMQDAANSLREKTTERKELDVIRRQFGASDTDVELLSKVFDFFDLDGEGTMTIEELEHVLSFVGRGVKEADLKDIMKSIDTNGDGIVARPEFITMCFVLQNREWQPEVAAPRSGFAGKLARLNEKAEEVAHRVKAGAHASDGTG